MHRAQQVNFAQIPFSRIALDVPQRRRSMRLKRGNCGLELGLGEGRGDKKQAEEKGEKGPKLHSRHRAPAAMTTADTIRRTVNLSEKKKRAKKTANSTLVSRKADTDPMGARAMAQITMP